MHAVPGPGGLRHVARPGAARRAPALVLLMALSAALASACSSPGHPSSNAGRHPPSHGTATSAVPTTVGSTTTLPAASTSGPLQLGAPIAVPVTAMQVAAAEGPDGAVFAAPQNPLSASPSVVWVVDGDRPAAVAEHTSSGVAALAADATNLYVATYASVTAYDRTSGNQDAQWSLPTIDTSNSSNDDLVSMTASGGRVLVAITQHDTQSVYRIFPGSKAAPHLVVQGTGVAFGPDGSVYYERSDDHLAELGAHGTSTVGPLLANAPNGLGGGVQFIDTVAGGVVWVSEPAGQGLDAQYTEYDATTLRQLGTFGGSTTEQIVDTSAGALVLSTAEGPVTCASASPTTTVPGSNECVSRLTRAGSLIDALSVDSSFVLVGPDPAVIGENADSTALVVQRLS